MPRPENLVETEITLEGGYWPSVPDLSPKGYQTTINAGSNVWARSGGKIEVANGLSQVSSTNVGARLFAADTQRASIAGGLNGDLLPYAGFLRYQNACLLYLSENTSAQVYLNETAVTDLTTSSTAGRLRVAVPDGSGGYDVFDAGFDKPPLAAGDITLFDSVGVKDMQGLVGVALAKWRTKTNAWGQPSDVIFSNITAGTQTVVSFELPTPDSGQDGWLILGTIWGDRSGVLRLYRRVYIVARGTFTATNGSANITGVNTFWTQDLGRFDKVDIDGGLYDITSITDDNTATISPNFTGTTGSGKTMRITDVRNEWLNGDLGEIIDRNIQRPLRAAGITTFSGRVVLWGIPDTNNATSTDATGNGFAVMLDNNPEHIGTIGRVTASGSNLVNCLPGEARLYLMTTTSLEIIERVSSGDQPFVPKIIAEPGFAAATNGIVYKDWFYGFNKKPLRTRAENNIDVKFGEPVEDDMADWNAARVIVAVDPDNEAVLFIHDDGSATTVLPWMAQLGVWNPPLNFSARIIDAQVVNGTLYVTYLSGGNYRVNEWEGGTGIGGTRYVASQYLDPNLLNSNRIKQLTAVGKLGSLSVFTATPDAAVPDVSDLGDAAVTFTLSDSARRKEPMIATNLVADAAAFRLDFASNDGTFDKLVVGGLPRGQRR